MNQFKSFTAYLATAYLFAACGTQTPLPSDESVLQMMASGAVVDTVAEQPFQETSDGWVGTLRLSGYAEVIQRQPVECLEETCEQDDYVFFHILNSGNVDMAKFLLKFRDDAYVNDDAIGLGCKKDRTISYEYHNDQRRVYTSLSQAETTAILQSTPENPVTLIVKKGKNPGPDVAASSACYSHFTYEVAL